MTNPVKILYVSSATDLFLKDPPLSTHVKELCEKTALRPDAQIRLLLPLFGKINKRTNNIHTTLRLSGINIPLKERISLVVKVPSVRGVKLPIYFVDNEELFERKGVFEDSLGKFYDDNDLRAIFFCKSVLAILEKLAWIPNIIHCHGWMTSFIPLFLRKAYTESHPLRHTKSVYTLYDDAFDHTFSPEIAKHLRYKQLKSTDVADFASHANYTEIVKLAMANSDKVTRSFDTLDNPLAAGVPFDQSEFIPYDDNVLERYMDLYKEMQAK